MEAKQRTGKVPNCKRLVVKCSEMIYDPPQVRYKSMRESLTGPPLIIKHVLPDDPTVSLLVLLRKSTLYELR